MALVAQQPLAAWDDIAFATAARELIGHEARLAELGVADRVLGETDSERVFALATAEIAAHGRRGRRRRTRRPSDVTEP